VNVKEILLLVTMGEIGEVVPPTAGFHSAENPRSHLLASVGEAGAGCIGKAHGAVYHSMIVVPAKDHSAFFANQVYAGYGVRTVADQISQAVDVIYVVGSYVRKNRFKRFAISVNI
jgi:hypothetical protein